MDTSKRSTERHIDPRPRQKYRLSSALSEQALEHKEEHMKEDACCWCLMLSSFSWTVQYKRTAKATAASQTMMASRESRSEMIRTESKQLHLSVPPCWRLLSRLKASLSRASVMYSVMVGRINPHIVSAKPSRHGQALLQWHGCCLHSQGCLQQV